MLHTDMEQVVTGIVQWKLRDEDRRRAIGLPRSPADAAREQRELAAATETLREAILLRNYDVVRDPIQYMLGKLGIEVQEGTEAWQELAHETTRALMDTTEEIARRDRGEFQAPSVYFQSVRNAECSQSGFAKTGPIYPQPQKIQSHRILNVPTEGSVKPESIPSNETRTDTCGRQSSGATSKGSESVSRGVSLRSSTENSADMIEDRPEERSIQAPEEGKEVTRVVVEPAQPVLSDVNVADAYDTYLDLLKNGKPVFESGEANEVVSRTDQQMENDLSTAKLVKKIIGHRLVASITKEDCTELFSLIQRLPNSYGRSRSETRSPQQIVEDLADKEKSELDALRLKLEKQGQTERNILEILAENKISRMSVATVYRKMQEVKRFFRYAHYAGMISRNPMDGVIWKKNSLAKRKLAEGDRKRKTWGDKLPALFRTPRFQNFSEHPTDPLVWACLIAVFSGARQQEILQLKVADFESEGDIPYFHVRNGTNQHVKTLASIRRVPLHDKLIELGLLDLLELRRREGEIWLFPELELDPHRKKLSTFFSEEFTKFRRNNRLYEKLRDFHSFRKGVNTKMRDAKVPLEIRKALLGHAENEVNNECYADDFPLEDLRTAINTAKFDTSMLRNPFLSGQNSEVTDLTAARFRRAYDA